MRLAILSDIHGNLLALDAVLADLAAQGGADHLVVAGDLCADGPRPREVLERVRGLGCAVVQGNTDRDLAHSAGESANLSHAAALAWAREQLSVADLDYLGALPFSHRIAEPTGSGEVLIVHANPRDLHAALRPLAPEEAILPLLADVPDTVTTVVFGHLHIPYVRRVGRLLLADIASVGLPKDGDRRAGYGLLTWQDDGWAVEQRRVEYPVGEVVTQLREANPPHMAEQIRLLLRARYPNMTEARGGRVTPRRVPRPATVPAADAPVTADDAPVAVTVGGELVVFDDSKSNEVPTMDEHTPDMEPAITETPSRAASPTDAVTLENTRSGEEIEAASPVPEAAEAPTEEAPVIEGVLSDASAEAHELAASESADLDTGTTAVADEEAPAAASADAAAEPKRKGKKGRKKHGQHKPDADGPDVLRANSAFADVVPTLLVERSSIVLSHLAAVRANDDPEAVHDMRVAIRRLRAALDVAEPFYAPKPFRRHYRRLRRLASALGAVRDHDVQLAFLRERAANAAPDELVGLTGLIAALAEERDDALDTLLTALDAWGDQTDSRATELLRFAGRIKATKGRGRETVAAIAAQAMAARVDAFVECGEVFVEPDGASAEDFHALRIAAKQLRYALELFAPVLGAGADTAIGELRSLQESLGLMHDRDVLGELLVWERGEALERELHLLEFAILNPGSRAERLTAVREQLAAPASFATTAIGVYGLLIDVTDERDSLEAQLRERWAALTAGGFLARLYALTVPSELPAVLLADETTEEAIESRVD